MKYSRYSSPIRLRNTIRGRVPAGAAVRAAQQHRRDPARRVQDGDAGEAAAR